MGNNICPDCKVRNKRSWNDVCYKCGKQENLKTHWQLEPCNVYAKHKKVALDKISCNHCIERKKRRIEELQFRQTDNSTVVLNLNTMSKKNVDKILSYLRISPIEAKSPNSSNNKYYFLDVIDFETNMSDFYYIMKKMKEDNLKITGRILLTSPVCYICLYFVSFNDDQYRELDNNLFAHNKCLSILSSPSLVPKELKK